MNELKDPPPFVKEDNELEDSEVRTMHEEATAKSRLRPLTPKPRARRPRKERKARRRREQRPQRQ